MVGVSMVSIIIIIIIITIISTHFEELTTSRAKRMSPWK